ncbi:flavin reductase family protein [Terrisporobacter sp.]
MQKNIGSVMGLYPTPLTVVGTVVDGRVNWLPIAHVGVVEHHTFLISVDKNHELSNKGIQENKTVSVSLVNQNILRAADYCGIVKGAKVDKSDVFAHHFGELKGAPIIDEAPLSMECEVLDMFEIENFNNYIVKPVNTYVQEEFLNERGRVDYEKMSPVLFEFQNANYLSTGSVVGKCWVIGKDYKENK